MHTFTPNLLIGFVGVERSGKDTIADYLVRQHGFKKYSLASPIREIGKIMFGWSDEQVAGSEKDIVESKTGIKPRDFLTWFGTQICQFEIYDRFPELKNSIPPRTIWANMMDKFVKDNISTIPIVITDIRFKHEADIFKELGGLLFHISRRDMESPEQLSKYDLSYLIKNRIDYIFDNNNDVTITHTKMNELIITLTTNDKYDEEYINITQQTHNIDMTNNSQFI